MAGTENPVRAQSAVRRHHPKRDSKQKGRLQSLVVGEALREQQVQRGGEGGGAGAVGGGRGVFVAVAVFHTPADACQRGEGGQALQDGRTSRIHPLHCC